MLDQQPRLPCFDTGKPVTVVTRDRDHAQELERAGATIAVADVHDVDAVRAILRTGRRALLLNPPADIRGDSDVEERFTASAIVEAVKSSGLEKVVAASTYGAQSGERLGDLNVLFEFEEGLRAQAIPLVINRGAYYFSNWTSQIEAVGRGVNCSPSSPPISCCPWSRLLISARLLRYV